MRPDELNCILEGLQSSDLVRQVDALDDYFSIPPDSVSDLDRHAVLSAGVHSLETATNPLLIMERLFRFGADAEQPLTELLKRDSSPEDAKGAAALILLSLGSHVGVPILVQEIARGGSVRALASSALSDAGIADHAPLLIERLRRSPAPTGSRIPSEEDDIALGALIDLIKLRMPIPEDVMDKFLGPQAPSIFRSVYKFSRPDN